MHKTNEPRYALAPGTQVREEDFGLLFYTMKGPRLYFLSSGRLLAPSFFEGKLSLDQWTGTNRTETAPEHRMQKMAKVLGRLAKKGVILER